MQRSRWWRAGIVLAATAVTAAMTAVNAGAIVAPAAAPNGHAIGFFPSIGYAQAHHVSCTTDCTAMTYHAGGAVQHGEREYLIFWSPSGHYFPASYRNGMSTFLNDAAYADYSAGNVFSVAQQYYDTSGPSGAHRYVPYGLINGGAIVDTNPYPASACSVSGSFTNCLSDAQIQAEIKSVVESRGLPENLNTQYTLFTPVNVDSCTSFGCAYTDYCAYHGYYSGTSGTIVYANMPWAYHVNGCDVDSAFGTGFANASAVDPEISVWTHELIETMTDVQLNAWYDGSGNEIGDKCAYLYNGTAYGSMSGLSNNGLGYYNLVVTGDQYLIQDEFSNRDSNGSSTGCVKTDADTQPSISMTINPNPPTHGTSAKFTANVSDPYGVSTYSWSFGDGATAATNPVNHTYSSAGSRTVTLIVTDNHGNEKKITQVVNVS